MELPTDFLSLGRGSVRSGLSRYIWGDHRETQVTLDLHEDGLILCENGVGLSHGSLNASHPVREGCMGSPK